MAIFSGNRQKSAAPFYLGYLEGWEAPPFGSSRVAILAAAEDASPISLGDEVARQHFLKGFIAAVQEREQTHGTGPLVTSSR